MDLQVQTVHLLLPLHRLLLEVLDPGQELSLLMEKKEEKEEEEEEEEERNVSVQ